MKALVQPRLPRKVGGTCLPPEIVCKDYVLINKDKIEKLIFTSGENYNNALANFKRIMGDDFDLISSKVVSNLPSPSGGSNTSNFNSDNTTLGLRKGLYEYMLKMNNQDDIDFVKKQWIIKQAASKGEKINRIPKNMLTKFKVWKYEQIFPSTKCIP